MMIPVNRIVFVLGVVKTYTRAAITKITMRNTKNRETFIGSSQPAGRARARQNPKLPGDARPRAAQSADHSARAGSAQAWRRNKTRSWQQGERAYVAGPRGGI